jgi:hypothetical protein
MDPILYFTTFVAVVTLFASAIAVLVLVLVVKLFQASRRIYRKLRYPEADAGPAKQVEFDGWHPAHLKRAGQ